MTRKARLAVVTAVCVAALATIPSALAAFAPKLSASTNAAGLTVLSYSQAPTDDPAQQLIFYTPADYIANVGQLQGEQVGTVTATALAGDLGGSKLALSGNILAQLATDTVTVGGQTLPLATVGATCTGQPA